MCIDETKTGNNFDDLIIMVSEASDLTKGK